MEHILIVIDMQNDFISGALGTPEAQAIVPYVEQLVAEWDGPIYFTQDTHETNYLDTQEGQHLPVVHCVKHRSGWNIHESLIDAARNNEHVRVIEKPCFGSLDLVRQLQDMHAQNLIGDITIVGLCTDICVVSNVLLVKAGLPEVPLIIDAAGCAGVTPEKHRAALETMRSCQCHVIND